MKKKVKNNLVEGYYKIEKNLVDQCVKDLLNDSHILVKMTMKYAMYNHDITNFPESVKRGKIPNDLSRLYNALENACEAMMRVFKS
jgi:hypothetical protein